MDKLTDEEIVELKILYETIAIDDGDDLISADDLKKLYEENGFEIPLHDIQEFINDYKDNKDCINFPTFVRIITNRINTFNNKIDRRIVTNFEREVFETKCGEMKGVISEKELDEIFERENFKKNYLQRGGKITEYELDVIYKNILNIDSEVISKTTKKHKYK